MKNLNYINFRDICLRLKYYPEHFKVAFFCNNIPEKENFIYLIKKITELDINFNDWKIRKNNVIFDFFNRVNIEPCSFCGTRYNIAIVSTQYNYETIDSIILPAINLEPCQECYFYNNYIFNGEYNFIKEHERYEEIFNIKGR